MNLIDEQIAIENNAHLEARARFEKYKMRQDETFVRNSVSDSLLSFLIPKFALAIEEWWAVKKGQGRGGGRLVGLKRELRESPLDSIGYSIATLKTLFTTLFQKRPLGLTAMSSKVFSALHLENSFQEFVQYGIKAAETHEERKDWRALSRKVISDVKDKSFSQKKKVMAYARATLTNLEERQSADKVRAGLALLNLASKIKVRLGRDEPEVNLFRMELMPRGNNKNTENRLLFTPEVQTYLAKNEDQVNSALFTCYPMVIPPTPWEGMFGGGYATPRGRGTLSLIKSYNIKLYKDADIGPEVFKAVNTVQNTPWVINKKIFAVMEYCDRYGYEVGGLAVGKREFVLPERIEDEDWLELSSEEKTAVVNKRKALHREVDATLSKQRALSLKISMARRFLKYEKIYFPHTLDFRGRIYPIASAVNPQSDKFGQALLQFAEGQALGLTGEKWLAIHGANCFGLDGESLDVRLKFIEENKVRLLSVAENPLGTRDWWGKADDAFGFLAFCCEWAEMHKCSDHRVFMSRLPIKLDATSSGLQHYSAILRDEDGASATNLLDGPRSDIYKRVAKATEGVMQALIASEPDVEKKQWMRYLLLSLNRNICKPATMCKPYGISMFGATEALTELHKDGKMEESCLPKEDLRETSKRLRVFSTAIMQGVGEVVKSADIGMEWLQSLDRAAMKSKKRCEPLFTTKLGFPFYQQYYKATSKRVKALMGETTIRLNVKQRGRQLDKRKSNSAIAPNFIHSQDATHLLKCSIEAASRGMTSFSFIHDSFGVHAGLTEEFRDVIRESFVWLYEGDTFGGLRDQWGALYSDVELPLPPYDLYGKLDLKDCLKSTYMFN